MTTTVMCMCTCRPLPCRAGGVPRRATQDTIARRTVTQDPCNGRGLLLSPWIHERDDTPHDHHRTGRPGRPGSATRDLTIVDVRPLAAYNGWRLGGEARGGHIPGAVAFPSAWLRRVDAPEIERLLAEKASPPTASVVVYGDGDSTTRPTRRERARRPRHRPTCASTRAASPPGRPTRRCRSTSSPSYDAARPHRLAAPRPRRRATRGRPGRRSSCSSTSTSACPRSTRRATSRARSTSTRTGSRTRPTGTAARPRSSSAPLRALGITHDTTVIVYGRDTEGDANEKWPGRRAGQIAATRALMILRYAGVDDVRLLDGGYDWWVRAGNPLETSPREPSPVAAFGVAIPLRPEVIVDIEEAKEIIADPDGAALVERPDVARAHRRGQRLQLHRPGRAGSRATSGATAARTPTTCSTTATSTTRCGRTRRSRRTGQRPGSRADKWVAFYCGTGWRASETWFYAYLQDWPRIAVYDGGWFEWSQDPDHQPDRDRRSRDDRRGRRLGRRIGSRVRVARPEPDTARGSSRLARAPLALRRLWAALAWASWICLKTLPIPGRIRSRASAAASRSRRRARSCSAGSRSSRSLTDLSSPRGGRRRKPSRETRARYHRHVPPDPIRLAIVGCGDVLYRHYLPALQPLAGAVQVAAFVDARPAAAERAVDAVADWSPGARAYLDVDSLLSDGGRRRRDRPRAGSRARRTQPAPARRRPAPLLGEAAGLLGRRGRPADRHGAGERTDLPVRPGRRRDAPLPMASGARRRRAASGHRRWP